MNTYIAQVHMGHNWYTLLQTQVEDEAKAELERAKMAHRIGPFARNKRRWRVLTVRPKQYWCYRRQQLITNMEEN